MKLLFLYLYFILLRLTTSIRISSESNETLNIYREQKPAIYAYWFSQSFYMFHLFRSRKLGVFLTPIGKSDLLSALSKFMGFKKTIGNTEVGGRHALLKLMDHMKKGKAVLIAADGSRGLQRRSKTMSLLLSQETGIPIVPVAFHCKRAFNIRFEERTIALPVLFNTMNVTLGKPIQIKKHLQIDELDGLKNQLTHELNALSEKK